VEWLDSVVSLSEINARHSRMRSILFMDHSISTLKNVTVYSIDEKLTVASH
jgi:hypothetical protein